MSLLKIQAALLLTLAMAISYPAKGQSDKYKRSKQGLNKNKTKKSTNKVDKKLSSKDKKLDISDLEQKYWAPKDTDFSVVQNRTYTKNKKFGLTLMSGPVINEVFSHGLASAAGVSYFLSERMGVEATYISYGVGDSKAIDNFKELSGGGVLPDYGRLKSFYGVGFTWVPFYAKMSLLGKKILYFDMAFTPGIGVMNYDQIAETGNTSQSSLSYYIDISQYYFFEKWFAIRVDLKNQWYNEKIVKYRTGVEDKSQNRNATAFLIGITFFVP